MALLFQSNPDRWNGRAVRPGESVRWAVSRYRDLMRVGEIVLLWEAQGKSASPVRGLYGWGITTSTPITDDHGRHRIPVLYVERWVAAADQATDVPLGEQGPPLAATEVLALSSWQEHLLSSMAIGTNFIVTREQLEEVAGLAAERFSGTQLILAARQENAGIEISRGQFKPQILVEG